MQQEVVLALLAKEPSHGYQLRARLRQALGPLGDQMNAGQVYVTLTRLEKAGLVASEPSAGPDSRDEAAAAVGISRKLAAFHLDKLVAAGRLEAGFALAGRAAARGPGVEGVRARRRRRPGEHPAAGSRGAGRHPGRRGRRGRGRPAGRAAGGGRARVRARFGRTGSAATRSARHRASPHPGLRDAGTLRLRARAGRTHPGPPAQLPVPAARGAGARPGLRGQPGVPGRVPARARRINRHRRADPAAGRLLRRTAPATVSSGTR